MTEKRNMEVPCQSVPWWERFWIYQSIRKQLIGLVGPKTRNAEGDKNGQENSY